MIPQGFTAKPKEVEQVGWRWVRVSRPWGQVDKGWYTRRIFSGLDKSALVCSSLHKLCVYT